MKMLTLVVGFCCAGFINNIGVVAVVFATLGARRSPTQKI
jgi:hypothetical protein